MIRTMDNISTSDLKFDKELWYKCSFYIKGISGESKIDDSFISNILKFAIDNMNGVDELKIAQCSLILEDQPKEKAANTS